MLPDIFRRQENIDFFDPFRSIMSEFDRNFLGNGFAAGFGKMMKTDIHEEADSISSLSSSPSFPRIKSKFLLRTAICL